MPLSLVEYGIFNLDDFNNEIIYNDQLPKGYYYHFTDNPPISKRTTKIPLMLNNGFGITICLHSLLNVPQKLKISLLHPEIENEESFSFTETSYYKTFQPEQVYTEIHIFEKKWEMIPGFWMFQVWDNAKLLLEKEFEVFIDIDQEEIEEVFFYDM